MRKLAYAVVGLGLLSAAPAIAALSAADKIFATEAAHGGLAEVQLGQLAEQKAASPQVKQFARRMVSDHTQANQELMQLGNSRNLTLPTQLDATDKSEMDRLSKMSGNAFDQAYMQQMVQDHQKTVADFRKQAESGSDPGLKDFAQKQLPILEQHLKMAEASAPRG